LLFSRSYLYDTFLLKQPPLNCVSVLKLSFPADIAKHRRQVGTLSHPFIESTSMRVSLSEVQQNDCLHKDRILS